MVEKGGGGAGRDGGYGRTVKFSNSETRSWTQGGLVNERIIMQESEVLKSCFGAAVFVISSMLLVPSSISLCIV